MEAARQNGEDDRVEIWEVGRWSDCGADWLHEIFSFNASSCGKLCFAAEFFDYCKLAVARLTRLNIAAVPNACTYRYIGTP